MTDRTTGFLRSSSCFPEVAKHSRRYAGGNRSVAARRELSVRRPRPCIPAAAACLAVAACLALAGDGLAGEAVPAAYVVSRCGEVVPARTIAYLASDLDCRGSGVAGVVLSNRSRLVMGGHALIGDPAETGADGEVLQGVRCRAGSICTIEGPGTIAGFSASGVAGTRVRISDVWIGDNARAGISAFENVYMHNVAVVGNGTVGVHAGGHVRATDADFAENPAADIVEWHAPERCPDRTHAG
jgi:hypothetical protein